MTPIQRPRLARALVLALLAAGCSDSPTTPEVVPSLSILHNSVAVEEETLAVGGSIQLSTRLTDQAGKALPERPVTWSSTAPEVAAVSPNGVVTGGRVGVARIVASVAGSADTLRVNVAAPLDGSVSCAPGATALSLAVGQVHTTTALDAPTLCIGGGEGSEYLLVPFFASHVPAATRRFQVNASGIVDLAVSLGQEQGPESVPATARSGPQPDGAFHLRLRELALPQLERRMRELHSAEPGEATLSRSVSAAPVPRVGDLLRLNVKATAGEACSDPVYRTGRVVAVTARAVIVADTANPRDGFTDADYQAFGTVFDQQIYPLNTRLFGEPADIDENQRVVAFFTKAVNDLTRANSGFYVAGFFFDRDLFPVSGRGACAGSNRAEMFYLMVPDPARAAAGEGVFTRERVRERTLAVVSHELQHLINASRRLYVNRAPVWEEAWLNEGLSHIAEELLFYQLARLEPRRNLDDQRLLQAGAQQLYREYQLDNELRLVEYLRIPETNSPMGNDNLATRGSIWSFLRYAADRRGGDERGLWHGLVNSTTAGMANLSANLGAGTSPTEWMRDWSVSLFTDDAGLGVDPIYTQPSWNHRALLANLRNAGASSSFPRYPLRVISLRGGIESTYQLQAGGSVYLRFGVAAGQRAAIRTSSAGLPAPSTLRLALVRTR